MTKFRRYILQFSLFALLATIVLISGSSSTAFAATSRLASATGDTKSGNVLSPYWAPSVRQWSSQVAKVSQSHGLDPDFVAAVIKAESDGVSTGISRVGAVGLMGVMPQGPGLEWRPPSQDLIDPGINLRWGVAILAEIIRQSGGDVSAALAAYNGGWAYAERSVPRTYATQVLDHYSRAVLVRDGIDPSIAGQWTLALRMDSGYIPTDSLLILGDQAPISGLRTYSPHTLFDSVDARGRSFHVVAYIVPVAIIVSSPDPMQYGNSDDIEQYLNVRMGNVSIKEANQRPSPRVLLACLPSISRLRGRQSTRWFAPSSCPAWHR